MNRIITLLLFFLFLLSLNGFAQTRNSSGSIVSEEFIFPFQKEHVHGSSIVFLPNGDLMACWFQGSGERSADDVRIMGARLKKGENKWTVPFLMADTRGIPDCNPVLFVNRKGKLFMFWITVMANKWENSIIRYRTTTDFSGNGAPNWEWQDDILLKPDDNFAKEVQERFNEMPESQAGWAAYAPLYDDMIKEASKDATKRSFGWMTRIHPITLESGRILLPLYSDGFNFSLIAISDDDGATWKNSLPIVGRGPIQPSLAVKKDGTIVAYMRDSGDAPNRVHISSSSDNGESWTVSTKTDIPNEASVEICVLKDGKWAFFGNDINNGRYQLSLYISDNEGSTWKWKELIEYQADKKGSFSYPCLIQTNDGLLNISYSYSLGEGKKTIKHVVVNPAIICAKQPVQNSETWSEELGYPIDEKVLDMISDYKLPNLDNFTSVPEGAAYEEKRSRFFEHVNSLNPGLTEIIFHPSLETDNLKSITGSWQQRAWEGELFSDPVVLKFFKDEDIVITNWREIMARFSSLSGREGEWK
jgi:predicted neuraminidase